MNTKNIDFNYLLEQAHISIGQSHTQIQQRYSGLSICLMELIAKGIHREHIEVSFNKQNGSVTYYFDKNRIVECTSICFYEPSDVDLFIGFLQRFANGYNYVKKHFIIDKFYYMTVEKMENSIHFYCYKFVDN